MGTRRTRLSAQTEPEVAEHALEEGFQRERSLCTSKKERSRSKSLTWTSVGHHMAQGQTGPREGSKSQSLCDYLSRWTYKRHPSVGARRWIKRSTGWNLVLCRNNKAHKQVSTCFLRFLFLSTIFQVFIEFVTIFLLLYVLVFWPQGTWHLSFPTRDQTCTPCIGWWWSLNHWATREVPKSLHVQSFCRTARQEPEMA